MPKIIHKNYYPIQNFPSSKYSFDDLPIYSISKTKTHKTITHIEVKSRAWKVQQFFIAFLTTLGTLGFSFLIPHQWQRIVWQEALTGKRFHRARIALSTISLPPPYIALYQKKESFVAFLAAVHTSNLSSSTHKMILNAIDRHAPDALILEGFFESKNLNPLPYITTAHRQVDQGACNESLYSVHLAAKHNIPFYDGEPSFKDIYNALIKKGFSPDDFYGLQAVTMIPEWHRENRAVTHATIDNFFSHLGGQLGPVMKMDHRRFSQWYHNKTGEPLNYPDLSVSKLYNDPIMRPIKEIHDFITEFRNEQLVKTIEEVNAKHKKILVIYGSDHQKDTSSSLERLFGKPSFQRTIS